jgi:hypothetical protein
LVEENLCARPVRIGGAVCRGSLWAVRESLTAADPAQTCFGARWSPGCSASELSVRAKPRRLRCWRAWPMLYERPSHMVSSR